MNFHASPYFLNVALHAAVLSVFAVGLLTLLRQPGQRSFAAIVGLLTVGILPWITALRPGQPAPAPVSEIQPQPASALPTWTVVTLPAKHEKLAPQPSEPIGATAKFVIPDPATTMISIWGAGTGAGLLLMATALLKVFLWRRSLLPPDDAAWQTLRSTSSEIPSRRRFLIAETSASPCVTGFFKPKVALPRFLLEPGSEAGLRWAVRHEIAHWQAGDSRWMILFTLVRCTHWWNPLVHQLIARWADAREQLCDLHATGISENRADYGEFLIAMARRITQQPPLAVAMARRLHTLRLKGRIVSLLDAGAGSEKPAGKRFIGLSCSIFIASAAMVSSLRIGAEERPRETPVPETETSAATPSTDPPVEVPAAAIPFEPAPTPPPAAASPTAVPAKDSAPHLAAVKHLYQLKLTTWLLISPSKSTPSEGVTLGEDQLQTILKSSKTIRGTSLMTVPSITAKIGQEATIEIIREVPGTLKQIEKRGDHAPAPKVGITLGLNTSLAEEQLELKISADYRYIPGRYQPAWDSDMKPPADLDPDKIKIIKRDITVRVIAGMSLRTDMGEIEPGKYLQILTRIQPVDETGRILDASGKPVDEPKWESPPAKPRTVSADVKGRLRLKGFLVDLPGIMNKLPEPAAHIGFLPSSKSEIEMIRKMPGYKFHKLEEVEISLNQRKSPWPEFSGFEISAAASTDYQEIDITDFTSGRPENEPPITSCFSREQNMISYFVPTKTRLRALYIEFEVLK